MKTNAFPAGTRFYREKDLFIAIIGGPCSGGALVTFQNGRVGDITDDQFFKICPSKELSEADFREAVGTPVLDAWFASNPAAISEYVAGTASLGDLAGKVNFRTFAKLSPSTQATIAAELRRAAEERESDGPWIGTDDWNEVMEGRPPE